MRTLYDEPFANLNISTEQELAQFVTDQHVALIVMINVDNLSGSGGEYTAKLTIDDRLVVPDRKVVVEPGEESVSFQSRDIVLYENGVLTIKLQGIGGDTNVSGRLVVIDTSPVTVEELSNLINGMLPEIVDTIKDAIGVLSVTVRPETKVLGPCQRDITKVLGPYQRTVAKTPQVKRC